MDINFQKKQLRLILKEKRSLISQSQKQEFDTQIFVQIKKIIDEIHTNIVFTYVCSKFEVDTLQIINYALNVGKKVAVPYCKNSLGEMDFYFINSLNELKNGSFDILEPDPKTAEKISDYSQGICLVPGLGFTKNGDRIGFGKGYYDRFLSEFSGTSFGLCYDCSICENIPVGDYDVSVDKVVTQTKIY